MKKIRLTGMLMALLAMLVCCGVSSCIFNDEPETPSSLFKKWYLADGSYVKFNPEGNGEYSSYEDGGILFPRSKAVDSKSESAEMVTYIFGYVYDDSDRQLKVTIWGMTYYFTIEKLTDTVLELENENGETISMTASDSGKEDVKELIVGEWGYAGYVTFKITADSLFYYDDGVLDEARRYRLNGNTIELYDYDFWDPVWTVKEVTEDYLICTYEGDMQQDLYFFSIRKEPDTVGDISLLYDKDWTGIDDMSSSFTHFNFYEDGTAVYSDKEGKLDIQFTYDAGTRKFVMTSDGEKEVYKVRKLTSDVFILDYYEGGVLVDSEEYRVINFDGGAGGGDIAGQVSAVCSVWDVIDDPENGYPYADVWSRTEFHYYADGKLSKVIEANGKMYLSTGLFEPFTRSTYTYDYNNRGSLLVSVKVDEMSECYHYDGVESLSLENMSVASEGKAELYAFVLDDEGHVSYSSMTDMDYRYDSNGQLVEMNRGDYSIKCGWTDGNMSYFELMDGSVTSFGYTPYENSYSIDLNGYICEDYLKDTPLPDGYFGKRSKNIVETGFQYSFDEHNHLVNLVKYNEGGYHYIEYDIQYNN